MNIRRARKLTFFALVLTAVLAVAVPVLGLALEWGYNNDISDVALAHSFGNGTAVPDPMPAGKPGDTITVQIPLKVEFNYHNLDDQPVQTTMWTDSTVNLNGQAVYEPHIAQVFSRLTLAVDVSNPDALPFDVQQNESYVRQIVQTDDRGQRYNVGYADFSFTLKADAAPQGYAIPLIVTGEDFRGNAFSKEGLVYRVIVQEPAPTAPPSSGGGGGGGGGGGVAAPKPQAKLMVVSVATEPELPKAGDEFDIVLTLRNTSESQYLQNITMTYTAQEDMLLPVGGTNNVYIPRIDKSADYDVRLNVKAMPEVTGQPVKLDLSFDFEDSSVTSLTASQTVTINVDQPIRIQIDDPVMPASAPYAGDVVEFTMTVYNLGRPMLYNVMARVVSDNPNLMQAEAGFGGNMESGTNKALELSVIAMEPGDYSASVELSYENAEGDKFVETRSFSLYAMEVEDYSMDDSWMYEQAEPEEQPAEEPAALLIMQSLPWWLYAAIAGILLLLILTMGLSARKRRRKELEEDEMD